MSLLLDIILKPLPLSLKNRSLFLSSCSLISTHNLTCSLVQSSEEIWNTIVVLIKEFTRRSRNEVMFVEIYKKSYLRLKVEIDETNHKHESSGGKISWTLYRCYMCVCVCMIWSYEHRIILCNKINFKLMLLLECERHDSQHVHTNKTWYIASQILVSSSSNIYSSSRWLNWPEIYL